MKKKNFMLLQGWSREMLPLKWFENWGLQLAINAFKAMLDHATELEE